MEATLEAPATAAPVSAPSTEKPATPGPKPFDRGVATKPPESREERYGKYAGKDHPAQIKTTERTNATKPPPPTLNAPVPPKAEAKPAEAAAPDKKVADGVATPETGKVAEKPASKPSDNWKSLRTRAETAEARLKELEANRVPDQERSTLTKRMETLQQENTRLANLIRHKDYQNSPEFVEKYHKPYEDKMGEVMSEVIQIPVTDPKTGETRYANDSDIMELVRLDPVMRLQKANELFGDLGTTVAGYAKDLRSILLARNKALDDEIKNGSVREQQTREQAQKQAQTLEKYVTDSYTNHFKVFQEHPDTGVFLKPIQIPDGQQPTPEEAEYNTAVLKGQKDLEDAWKMNPAQTKTREELDKILKTRTKFGARAAAFPALFLTLQRTKAENAALKAELKQYEKTTPEGGGRVPNNGVVASNGKHNRDAEREKRYMEIAQRR